MTSIFSPKSGDAIVPACSIANLPCTGELFSPCDGDDKAWYPERYPKSEDGKGELYFLFPLFYDCSPTICKSGGYSGDCGFRCLGWLAARLTMVQSRSVMIFPIFAGGPLSSSLPRRAPRSRRPPGGFRPVRNRTRARPWAHRVRRVPLQCLMASIFSPRCGSTTALTCSIVLIWPCAGDLFNPCDGDEKRTSYPERYSSSDMETVEGLVYFSGFF